MHAVSLHHLSSPHSLNALGLGNMLKSTSGTEPSLLPHTRDTAPVKSKVAAWLTALQSIDYHSMVHTVYLSHHREGHHRHTGHHMIVDTPYIIITAQVPLHIYSDLPAVLFLGEFWFSVCWPFCILDVCSECSIEYFSIVSIHLFKLSLCLFF